MNKEEVQVDYENDEEEITPIKGENKEIINESEATTLYIDGFMKPFDINDVKELVSKVVSPIDTDDHFYMNNIKSFCYVTYNSLNDAKKAMADLNGKQFPSKFGNKLHVRITSVTPESMKRERGFKSNEVVPSEKRQREDKPKRQAVEVISIEDLFKKTKAKPEIFYKPLTDKEVEAKHKK